MAGFLVLKIGSYVNWQGGSGSGWGEEVPGGVWDAPGVVPARRAGSVSRRGRRGGDNPWASGVGTRRRADGAEPHAIYSDADPELQLRRVTRRARRWGPDTEGGPAKGSGPKPMQETFLTSHYRRMNGCAASISS
jgi:hypothetical protein